MTREEQAKYISEKLMENPEFRKAFVGAITDAVNEVVKVIKALQQEPCTDAISRKAVLDAISNEKYHYWALFEYVRQLPPVTPQYTDAEIQKMQKLEQAEIQKAYELGKAEMQPCEDAISRQAALEAIRKCHCEEWVKADIGASIEALQPIIPAEKVGRWVYNKNLSTYYGDVYTCSECGERCLESCYDHIDKLPDFCPKCHTKMEVEE